RAGRRRGRLARRLARRLVGLLVGGIGGHDCSSEVWFVSGSFGRSRAGTSGSSGRVPTQPGCSGRSPTQPVCLTAYRREPVIAVAARPTTPARTHGIGISQRMSSPVTVSV